MARDRRPATVRLVALAIAASSAPASAEPAPERSSAARPEAGGFVLDHGLRAGVRWIGDEESRGELRAQATVVLSWAPSYQLAAAEAAPRWAIGPLVAASIAEHGGGIGLGGQLLLRRPAGAALLEVRLAALAPIAADDGHPPLLVTAGGGLGIGGVALRFDGEVGPRDVGGGASFGVLAGIGGDVGIGLVAVELAVAALGYGLVSSAI
jgi:hypothetical protein